MGLVSHFFEQRMTTQGGGTLQEPARTIMEAFGATPTLSGTSINETTAEGIPAVYACVRVIAETVGQTPLKVFRLLGEKGNKEPDKTHPLYAILHDLANPEMTSSEMLEMLTGHACLWGNGYAEIERRKSGTIKALWPLHPGCVRVDRGPDNRLRYTYIKPGGGEPVVYHWDPIATPIFHLRYNGGRSPIRVLREHLSSFKALQEYHASLMGNQGRPGGVLQSKDGLPTKLTQPQIDDLRVKWNEIHRGPQNAGKIAILPGGLQWQDVGMPPEDAQFAEVMSMGIEQTASLWRVPLFMIQHTEKSTTWGTGIEQLSIGFVRFTMMPWYIRWQQAIARDLLTYKSFETHQALFIEAALTRGSQKDLVDSLQVERQNGVINANEWRELTDRNTIDGPEGDEYWRPANYVDAGAEMPIDPAVPPAGAAKP